jgi:glucose-1-phosphate cytidylyltransferase
MKVVLLAGGFGTRLAEDTQNKPKPMVEVGGIPLLVHLMGIYAAHGHTDFVIACGYRGDYIKDYFSNYHVKHTDWMINLKSAQRETCHSNVPDWNIWAIDTGLHTMTGGRVQRLRPLLGDDTFLATYGDGVADVDLGALVRFHRSHGRVATVTAVRPPARFGCLDLDGPEVRRFSEKPQASDGWINGGFFVFEPGVFDYLSGDPCVLERDPMEALAADGQLMAYQHHGFWQPMDTLRDRQCLEQLWSSGHPPWLVQGEENDDRPRLLPESSGAGNRHHGVQGHLARKLA